MAWSKKKNTCYTSEEARCKDVYNKGMWNTANKICGYVNQNNQQIKEDMVCYSSGNSWRACGNSNVSNGGKCISDGNDGCGGSTINSGAICVGNYIYSCSSTKIEDGAICYANSGGTCPGATYYSGTGCCCGQYCNEKAQKCIDIGVKCDDQYIK